MIKTEKVVYLKFKAIQNYTRLIGTYSQAVICCMKHPASSLAVRITESLWSFKVDPAVIICTLLFFHTFLIFPPTLSPSGTVCPLCLFPPQIILATKVAGPSVSNASVLDRSYMCANRHDPPVNDGTQPEVRKCGKCWHINTDLQSDSWNYHMLYIPKWVIGGGTGSSRMMCVVGQEALRVCCSSYPRIYLDYYIILPPLPPTPFFSSHQLKLRLPVQLVWGDCRLPTLTCTSCIGLRGSVLNSKFEPASKQLADFLETPSTSSFSPLSLLPQQTWKLDPPPSFSPKTENF